MRHIENNFTTWYFYNKLCGQKYLQNLVHYLSKAKRGMGGGGEFAYFNLIFVAISRCQGFEDFIPQGDCNSSRKIYDRKDKKF